MIIKPVFQIIIWLIITGLMLMIAGLILGTVFHTVRDASNMTSPSVYTQVSPHISNFSKVFTIIGGFCWASCFILFVVEVVYGRSNPPPLSPRGDNYV